MLTGFTATMVETRSGQLPLYRQQILQMQAL